MGAVDPWAHGPMGLDRFKIEPGSIQDRSRVCEHQSREIAQHQSREIAVGGPPNTAITYPMLQLVRGRRPPYMSDVAVDWRPANLQCINNVKLQLVGGRRPPFYIMSDAAGGGRLNALLQHPIPHLVGGRRPPLHILCRSLGGRGPL